MEEIRIYNNIKLSHEKKFKTLEDELMFFSELDRVDPNKAKKYTYDIYEDMLHVKWSWYFIFMTLSFFMLLITAIVKLYFMSYIVLPFVLFFISITFHIVSLFLKNKLNNIYRTYIIGKAFLENYNE